MKIYAGNINDHTTEDLIARVHEERVKYAMKYRFEADRKRSLLAHALLNRAVQEHFPDIKLPVMPVTDKHGKPHLFLNADTSDSIYFSLSHSGDYAVCAVHDSPVGVDIEVMGKENGRIAERFFAHDELKYIHDAASFYHIWTLKESFLKVVGLGMRLPMDSFCVTHYDAASGYCGFSLNTPCSRISDPSADEILCSIKPFMKENSDELTPGGKCISFTDGYSLAVAACNLSQTGIYVEKCGLH